MPRARRRSLARALWAVVGGAVLSVSGFGAAALAGGTGSAATILPRATTDRPDDLAGPQFRLMYVLPSDGVDRALDTDGTIVRSATAFQRWLAAQTSGQALRFDTSGGAFDIGFFRLSKTDADVAARGASVRDEIEAQMIAAGYTAAGKIYGVYYDGSSTFACGGASWPPTLPGNVAALYLKGAPPGVTLCGGSANAFAAEGGPPTYWEFALGHDLLHTIGIVGTCAPNHTRAGHVSDDNRDLMYAGDQPWQPSLLDIGRNDYYGHSIPGCVDLATSGYLGPYAPPAGTTATTTATSTTTGAGATQPTTTAATTTQATTTATTALPPETTPSSKLAIGRFSVLPRRPRPGQIVAVRASLRANAIPDRVVCRGNVGRRVLRATVRGIRDGAAACSWRIPLGTRGRVLNGTIVVGADGRSTTRRFAVRIA